MELTLPPLPYAKDALEPFISARTVDLHYDRHHRGYLEKLIKALGQRPSGSLEHLVRTARGDVFNNAGQVWNHNFYWSSMSPDGGGQPQGPLAAEIERCFGSYADFKQHLAEAANTHFGSGWAWLSLNDGRLEIESTSNAESPLLANKVPLLTIDVWEHAYYLDYQHERGHYTEAFLEHLINWRFAQQNFEHAISATAA